MAKMRWLQDAGGGKGSDARLVDRVAQGEGKRSLTPTWVCWRRNPPGPCVFSRFFGVQRFVASARLS
eukprot:4207038-Prymnesium_polylepis.1